MAFTLRRFVPSTYHRLFSFGFLSITVIWSPLRYLII
jgi:hypothetical protein